MSENLKPFTNYICPVGHGQLGHSSHGDRRDLSAADNRCSCGTRLVEEQSTNDGFRYRLSFESVPPHFAADMQHRYGSGVWRALDAARWQELPWHEVTREEETPGEIRAQYDGLCAWAESHEQPVRNVRLLRARVAPLAWEPAQL